MGTTVAGRYALEDTLGQGGMGQVYRARHLELGKLFALKVIAPAFAGDELARALAKDPEQRHKSAGAFHYELNAVMDMLAIDRRRRIRTSSMLAPQHARDSTLRILFEHSTLPQAVVTPSGALSVANRAFAKLVAEDDVEGLQLEETALAEHVPHILDAVRTVLRRNVPVELRARIEAARPFELVTWVAPFSSEAVHLLVRVEAIALRPQGAAP